MYLNNNNPNCGSASLEKVLIVIWPKSWAAPVSSSPQVVTCVQTTAMVSVPCTGLSIRCAALLAPAARQHPSPCRTSRNGCGIYPERWDSSFNLPKFDAFILGKAAYSGWCVCRCVCAPVRFLGWATASVRLSGSLRGPGSARFRGSPSCWTNCSPELWGTPDTCGR